MGWYTVIKTIKGHRYIYRQRSWREGARVRTESRYVGPEDGGRQRRKGSQAGAEVNTTKPTKAKPATLRTDGEGAYIKRLLSGSDKVWQPSYRWDLAPVKKDQIVDREVWDLGLRMGVAMTTQMWPMPAPPVRGEPQNNPVYLRDEHRISIPDPGRYRPVDGTSPERGAAVDLLHEYVHSTMKVMDRPRVKSWAAYVREELVAEIGANIVARRLGFEQEDISRSQSYLQHYRGMLKRASADDDTAWAVREARRAADHILKFHSWGGWTPPVNTTKRKNDDSPK